jgi:hypothetical protein
VQTLDCGEEAATWFSKYILGKDTGARLGYYVQENPTFRRDISKVKLTAFQQHYKKLHNHDVVSCPQRCAEATVCFTLKMEEGNSSKCWYQTTWCRKPEDLNLDTVS